MSILVTCPASAFSTEPVSIPFNTVTNLVSTLSFTLHSDVLLQITCVVAGLNNNDQAVWLVVDGDEDNIINQQDLDDSLVYMLPLVAGDHTLDYQVIAFRSESTAAYAAVSVLDLTTGG